MSETMFKPGDVVQLVSGSVPMAVIWVEEEYGTMQAYCKWAEKTKNGQDMKGDKFPVTVLRHVEAKPTVQVPTLKSGFP